MQDLGRALITFGIVAVVVGALLMVGGRFGLGRLPGDISFHRGSASFYFPLATSIIASIVLTLILNLLLRRR